MNIKDLKPGSYKVVNEPTPAPGKVLNIKDLPAGSYKAVTTAQTNEQVAAPSEPTAASPIDTTGKAPILGGFLGNVVKRIVGTYKDTLKKLPEDVKAGAADIQKGGLGNIFKGVVKSTVRPAADVANAVFAPVSAVVGEAVDQTGAQKALEKTANFIVHKTGVADNPAVQSFATLHPNAEEDFNRALTLLMSKSEKGKIEPAKVAGEIKAGAEKTAANIKGVATKTADAVSAVPAKIQANAVGKLEQDYSKWTGATKSGVKSLGKIMKKTEALNNSGVEAKTPQRVLAEAKIIPKTEGTKFRTADQATKFREDLQPLHDAAQAALKEVEAQTPAPKVEALRSEAIAHAREMKMTEGDRKSLMNHINEEFDLLQEKYGETMPLTKVGEEKSNYWGATKFDSTKPLKGDANYQVGKAMQKTIERTAEDSGFHDVAQLNREVGGRLEAAKMLEKLDGQTLKGGRVGKYVLATMGSSLGHSLPGKIVGAIGGNMVADILMKADVASPIKRLILKTIKEKDPAAFDATMKWLEEQGQARDTRRALPYYEPGSPENPFRMPRVDTSGQVPNAPQPRVLPQEPRPGQLALPDRSQEIMKMPYVDTSGIKKPVLPTRKQIIGARKSAGLLPKKR